MGKDIVGVVLDGAQEWISRAAVAGDDRLLFSLEPFAAPLLPMWILALVQRVVWIILVCVSSRYEVAPSCLRC